MKPLPRIGARRLLAAALVLACAVSPLGCGQKNPPATTPDTIKAALQPHLTQSEQAKYDAAAHGYLTQQAQLRSEAIATHAAPAGVTTAQPPKTQ